MRPIEFGGCFGWLHPGVGSRGVVLCSSLGYEQLSIHRVWRELADQFAAAGLPALRFDWHGSGDSAGDYTDPERVRAWLESVRGAVARLRAETGVGEVVLVGLRMGATLAALVAEELGDVEALALLAPVVSGKAYVREMRALSAFGRGAATPAGTGDGEMEAAGFVMSASTLADLREIDLMTAVRRPPANRVLLMHRPDAPTDSRLAARLGELGADIQEASIEGYSDFVCDAEWSRAPRAAFDLLVDWVGQGVKKQPAQLNPPCPTPVQLRLAGAVEEPVELAGRARLVGTVCMPNAAPLTGDTSEEDRPALLFLNTGWYVRVGANRMAVTLARRFAVQGFTSLRLDLAGVGDSEAAPEGDSVVYNLKSCIDVGAALDWLASRGHRRVVLFGICSGGYLGFQAAYRDPRIVGQVLVNTDRFEWSDSDSLDMSHRTVGRGARQLIGQGLRAMTQPDKLGRLLSGDPVAWRLVRATGERVMYALRRRLGATADTNTARQMRELLGRRVKTLLVFSAGDVGLAECVHQFGAGFELLGKNAALQLEIIEDASHSLAERHSRAALTVLLDKFLAPWAATPAPVVRAT